jgi:hypothetical protein
VNAGNLIAGKNEVKIRQDLSRGPSGLLVFKWAKRLGQHHQRDAVVL